MTKSNSMWKAVLDFRNWGLPVSAVWIFVFSASDVARGATFNGAPVEATAGADGLSAPAQTSASIRSNLASVASSAFAPAAEGVVDLATFAAPPGSSVLNVPAPGTLSPVSPATDHIPEPGAIGFGLAVAALIFGNFTKALMRCWKITGTTPDQKR